MNWITDRFSEVGSAIGSAVGMKYCSDFNDRELLSLLATCAMDSYTFDGRFTSGNLQCVKHQMEDFGSGNGLQYGVYKVTRVGRHHNATIVAFRGTDSFVGVMQDADLFFGGHYGPIRIAIEFANRVACDNKANWVCGHSLGGLVAECVCSNTGIGGASFNGPGPWATLRNSLIISQAYDGKPFEIHLTRDDPISHIGSAGGPDSSHIGKPKWHSHGGNHSMEALLRDIGTL